MRLPWVAGRALTQDEFDDYCKQVTTDCRRRGIPIGRLPHFMIDFPILMKRGEWPRLARLAERLTQEVLAAEKELLLRPDLLRNLGLPDKLADVFRGCSRRQWPVGAARVMRFDFYYTTEGWKFSEANPDGPGGYVYACGFAPPISFYYPGFSFPGNPAAAYAEAIHKFVGNDGLIAFLHEQDRLAAWEPQFVCSEVEKLGMCGQHLYPQQLEWVSGVARAVRSPIAHPPSLLVRFYLSNWMLSRHPRSFWEPWFCGGVTPMSSPGTAIVIESKRFPLVWNDLNVPMSSWRSFTLESRCPNEIPTGKLRNWVLKPVLGMRGIGVAIPGVTKKEAFENIFTRVKRWPTKWVAQRRFESVPIPTERGPGHVCLGIYTVDGVTSGAYARIRATPLINERALGIPLLVPREDVDGPAVSSKVGLR
jgi:hypothetical protein